MLDGAAELTAMALHVGRRCVELALPAGVAMDRRELDARLAARAVGEGVAFWPGTRARLDPAPGPGPRMVRLTREDTARVVRAQVVLACDGLNGTLLADEPWARLSTGRPVRLGFSATVESARTPGGSLAMHVGPGGYVGLVRLADGQTHVGAALCPATCHAEGGPCAVIQRILARCGQPAIPALSDATLQGTGPLMVRRAAVAGPRVLAIGDACGYVEPFTGEGMAWAIRGAVEAAGLLPARACDWTDGLMPRWQERYETAVRCRQRWCARLRVVMQRPMLAAGCLAAAQFCPGATTRLARRICA